MQKSNKIITNENERLKQRINDLQKSFEQANRSKLQITPKPNIKRNSDLPDLSLSSIGFEKSISECNSLKKTCCCSKDPTQTDRSTSHKLCYFYEMRDPFDALKRIRPSNWCLQTPKKKLLNDIALSSVTLFKF